MMVLPWPSKDLSPNSRVHWSRKSKAIKAARYYAKFSVMRCLDALPLYGKPGPAVSYIFHPCDNRRRDLDNLIASTKAFSDGIADALLVNDATFKLSFAIGETRKPACVEVVIE